eukprot:1144879-Pelagomonas_calceolata.AAC.1
MLASVACWAASCCAAELSSLRALSCLSISMNMPYMRLSLAGLEEGESGASCGRACSSSLAMMLRNTLSLSWLKAGMPFFTSCSMIWKRQSGSSFVVPEVGA